MDFKICDKGGKEFLMAIEKFHGWQAPGMVMGGLMVDLALELLDTFSDPAAVVETHCFLPDAVQLFTPCTVGNGRLAILNWGKMALTLYDNTTSAGYRIWLDLIKARSIPSIYNWQMHLAPMQEQRAERLIMDMLTAGHSILSWRAVPITKSFGTRIDATMAVCPRCDEAYPAIQGNRCLSCQGKTYFELPEETVAIHPPRSGQASKSLLPGPDTLYCALSPPPD
ncbi:MAG: formylmethanofuran dehydrogenase subunit E family protein [Desulfobacterales bacterium]|nr:formylmethanofuran dehydrogenase subunit E family protein [Desulfobacterales bacterium]